MDPADQLLHLFLVGDGLGGVRQRHATVVAVALGDEVADQGGWLRVPLTLARRGHLDPQHLVVVGFFGRVQRVDAHGPLVAALSALDHLQELALVVLIF